MHAVLLVEDDESIRKFVRLYLERMGLHVHAAARGEDAAEIFHVHPEISLIVTDLLMPGISGMDLARHVREKMPSMGPGRGRNVPIVILTAHKDRVESAQPGLIQMVIEKPIMRYLEFKKSIGHFVPVE